MKKTENKCDLHFLHVGKTGGTAIKSALSDYLVLSRYSLLLHSHETSVKDVPENSKFMFFLRDPISRFVSGFYSRKRKGQPRYFSDWRPGEKEAFELFQTPNDLANALAGGALQDAALKAMHSITHLRKYKHWYVTLDYFESRLADVFYIGFQETMDSDFSKIKVLLDLPDSLQLPNDDVGAHRNPQNLDKSLTPKAVAALTDWYAEDYVFFSRCKDFKTSNNGRG